MPAQETATPMMLGSTSLAVIAVMGIPITMETIASANCRPRPLCSAAWARLASRACCRSSAARASAISSTLSARPAATYSLNPGMPYPVQPQPRHHAATPRSAYVGHADTAVVPDRAFQDSTGMAELADSVPDSSRAGSSEAGSSEADSSGEGNSEEGSSGADATEGPAVAAGARTCPQDR